MNSGINYFPSFLRDLFDKVTDVFVCECKTELKLNLQTATANEQMHIVEKVVTKYRYYLFSYDIIARAAVYAEI